MKGICWAFHSSGSLFSSAYIITSFNLIPVQMESALVITTSCWGWSFSIPWFSPNVTNELYWSVVGLMGLHDCIREMIVPFHISLCFCSVCHTLIIFQISAQYQLHPHRLLPPADCSQVKVEFPLVRDPLIEYCKVPILSSTFEFVWLSMLYECIMLASFLFHFYWLWQPRRPLPPEGDNVTAARDAGPRRGGFIYVGRHQPQISTDNHTYTSTYTIPRIHSCNHNTILTILMPIRRTAVLAAFTCTATMCILVTVEST